jgi:hypothetical protein
MKYFNDFNDMYNSNKQSNSMSVFNGVEEVTRSASAWAGGGKYGVYEIDIDGAYLGCVRFSDDERVAKYSAIRDKNPQQEDEEDYDYLNRLGELDDDPTGCAFSFWFGDYNTHGGYDDSITQKYGEDVLERLWEDVDDVVGYYRVAYLEDDGNYWVDVPLTKSEAKKMADDIYETAKSILG